MRGIRFMRIVREIKIKIKKKIHRRSVREKNSRERCTKPWALVFRWASLPRSCVTSLRIFRWSRYPPLCLVFKNSVSTVRIKLCDGPEANIIYPVRPYIHHSPLSGGWIRTATPRENRRTGSISQSSNLTTMGNAQWEWEYFPKR